VEWLAAAARSGCGYSILDQTRLSIQARRREAAGRSKRKPRRAGRRKFEKTMIKNLS